MGPKDKGLAWALRAGPDGPPSGYASGPRGSRSAFAPRLQVGAGGWVSMAQGGRSLRGRRRLTGAAWGVSGAGRGG